MGNKKKADKVHEPLLIKNYLRLCRLRRIEWLALAGRA